MSKGKTPQKKFSDAVRFSSIGVLIIAVVSSIISYIFAGTHGLWSALIGVAIGGGFVLITLLSFFFTMKSSPTIMAAVVLGGWLVKVLAFMIIFALLRNVDFLEPKVLAATIVFTLIMSLGIEVKSTL